MRKELVMALGFSSLLVLAACGRSAQGEQPQSQPTPKPTVDLKSYHCGGASFPADHKSGWVAIWDEKEGIYKSTDFHMGYDPNCAENLRVSAALKNGDPVPYFATRQCSPDGKVSTLALVYTNERGVEVGSLKNDGTCARDLADQTRLAPIRLRWVNDGGYRLSRGTGLLYQGENPNAPDCGSADPAEPEGCLFARVVIKLPLD